MNLVNLKEWLTVGHETINVLGQHDCKMSKAPIDGYYIGVIPELSVYGYGKTRQQAIEDIEFAGKAILRFLALHPEYATDNQPPQQGKK